MDRLRWYDFVPELVLAVGLTVFVIDETDAATSAFKSGRAITMVFVAAVVWLAARLITLRLNVRRSLTMAAFTLAALGALAVVVVPAYDDDTVVETLPPPAQGRTGTTAPEGSLSAPTAPVRVRTGPLAGIDHRGEGTVSILRRGDGGFVVALEDFDVQPGPDYDLYVVPGSDRETTKGGTRLDDLRGNRGTQYYDVPSTLDVGSGEWTVLIWCQTFAVPIANATPV